MRIEFLEDWDLNDGQNNQNHDSAANENGISNLIGQIRDLDGIKTQNYDQVPREIKFFCEQCIWSENKPILVVKGIHQRWGKNADPHIRIRFQYKFGPANKLTDSDLHVRLSQEAMNNGWCWCTVGISAIRTTTTRAGEKDEQTNTVIENWPAVIVQNFNQINRGGRGRTMSVGCRNCAAGWTWNS